MSSTLGLPQQVEPPGFVLADAPLEVAGALALPVLSGDDGPLLGPGAERWSDELLDVLEHHAATGTVGEVLRHVTRDPEHPVLFLVGLGAGTADDFRRAGAALARAAKDHDVLVSTITSIADDAAFRGFVVGLTLGSFEFHWRSAGAKAQPVRRVVLPSPDRQAALDSATAIALAGWRARFWCTAPSNLKSPEWLAAQATDVVGAAGVKVTVYDDKWLADKGFGGVLAVGGGSGSPPRFVRIDYTPARGIAKVKGHVALVGKGITFDSGGLSIKPGEAMGTMKRDMTGGAVVMATMAGLAAVGCPVAVTAFVPMAENAISGSAYRPGDVIRHYGGRTTEVTNTDAEGRLVLADAMAWAVEQVKPTVLVDVATLTGAMKVALGLRTGGWFANDEGVAEQVAAAGKAAGENLWRMPLAAVYEDRLDSKVADADNGAGGPGAITAALFLQHFAGDVPWAHLDIASIGDALEVHDVWTLGPTGFGARTLLHWLEQTDPLEGIR